MIRRILRTDVRAIAREAKREIVKALEATFYLRLTESTGCAIIGRGEREVGAGYLFDNPDADNWPDGARLLTIGRVTLAAWGGRPS